MALPSTGEISFGQINSELGRSFTALIGIDEAENGVYATINTNSAFRPDAANPASISEWYRYNHTAGPSVQCTFTGNAIISPSQNNRNGTLTITGVPGELKLTAFGGACARCSTEAYFQISGAIVLDVYAGPYQTVQSPDPGHMQGVGTFNTFHFAIFGGDSGANSGVQCFQ
jgi:hypothetical protein